jgi:hypothetical protein
MLKARVKKMQDGAVLALPKEAEGLFGEGEEADFFVLKKGLYLVSMPNADAPPVKKAESPLQKKGGVLLSLSNDERALSRKLSTIRFEDRQVPSVEKQLNASEKKALASLIGKKLVSLMKSAKYPRGVYGISDGLYGEMRTFPKTGAGTVASIPINTVEHLHKLGYMVLDNENDAKNVMPVLQDEISRDDVKGVRGFDKKYYVLMRAFYLEHEGGLLALLDRGPMHCDEMSAVLHLTPEATRTLLVVLAENGEVIEKQKGVWQRA